MPSRRVESLKRVFRLHERWPDELRYQIGVLRDEIADMGHRIRYNKGNQNLTEQELQEELKDMLNQRKGKIGARVGYILQTSYLTFALQNRDEFDELFKQLAG